MTNEMKIYEHKAQYYETDQMGIIHHSNYIRWFEEARTDMLDQIGFGYDQMEASGIIIPVLSINCDYKSMVRYGDTVQIIPKIEVFTGVKLVISYRILDKTTKELRTTGESHHCFLTKEHRVTSLKRSNQEMFDVFTSLIAIDFSE